MSDRINLFRAWSKGTTYLDHDEHQNIRDLLLGRKIVKAEGEYMVLDNGTTVLLDSNEGCGGCASGSYWMVGDIAKVDNVITAVDFEEGSRSTTEGGYEELFTVYRVFVVAEDKRFNLFTVEGDDGNGYYGSGYALHVLSGGADNAMQ